MITHWKKVFIKRPDITCFASQSKSSPEWSVRFLKLVFESVIRMLDVLQEEELSSLQNKSRDLD